MDVDSEMNTNDYASNGFSNGHWKGKIENILPDMGLKVKRRRKRSDHTFPRKDKPQGIKVFKKGIKIFLCEKMQFLSKLFVKIIYNYKYHCR